MTINMISNYLFNPFIPALKFMISGPEKVFAEWLANSQYNDEIEVQSLYNGTRATNCTDVDRRVSDSTFRLSVEKVKQIFESNKKFEKDAGLSKPTFYSVDDTVIVSEKLTPKKTRGEIKNEDDINITYSLGGGFSPSSQIEYAIESSVQKWVLQQYTSVAFVALFAQITAFLAAYKASSLEVEILMLPLKATSALLGGCVIFSAYRTSQLAEIQFRSIPTLGHWAAEIRRYAYLYKGSYVQQSNVKKYLRPDEINYLEKTNVSKNEYVLNPESKSPEQVDLDLLRTNRCNFFEFSKN